MKRITKIDDLPKPLRGLGMFNEESQRKLDEALRYAKPEVKDLLSNTGFEVYMCLTIEEMAKHAELDDCEKQVIIDRETNRYYLCAISVDPGRAKAKLEELESGLIIPVPDDGRKPPRILYFTEITTDGYSAWMEANATRRKARIQERLEREETNRLRIEGLEGTTINMSE